jgi:hypothetical protein
LEGLIRFKLEKKREVPNNWGAKGKYDKYTSTQCNHPHTIQEKMVAKITVAILPKVSI